MTQDERRKYLIGYMLSERALRAPDGAPATADEARHLLRALFNTRPPIPAGEEFLRVQDEYLKEEIRRKGITDISDIFEVKPDIYLWQGDITTLRCDAIVNAANSALLGCFSPNHACIDNAIHTFAGVELRLACNKIMKEQRHSEEVGGAKITPAYNLPSRYVIHTVGPTVIGRLTEKERAQLASCYRACLDIAEKNGAGSIAFPCISTGVFRFPPSVAAEIAVRTVTEFKAERKDKIKVIFNVFKDADYEIYRQLLG